MIVLFLFLNSIPFIRYLRRSAEKKRCHGDNNVALETTFWCVALRKSCLRVCSRSTHDTRSGQNFLQQTVLHSLTTSVSKYEKKHFVEVYVQVLIVCFPPCSPGNLNGCQDSTGSLSTTMTLSSCCCNCH